MLSVAGRPKIAQLRVGRDASLACYTRPQLGDCFSEGGWDPTRAHTASLADSTSAPRPNLPTAQCSSGISQSRPFPARPVKVMESASQIHEERPAGGPTAARSNKPLGVQRQFQRCRCDGQDRWGYQLFKWIGGRKSWKSIFAGSFEAVAL